VKKRPVPVSIPTLETLRKVHRKQARRTVGAVRVLSLMKAGASLQCSFERGRTIWRLSTGPFITQEVVNEVIGNPSVVGTGDCLFDDAHSSQTFRWINQEDRI
jgi:hypothetical protein